MVRNYTLFFATLFATINCGVMAMELEPKHKSKEHRSSERKHRPKRKHQSGHESKKDEQTEGKVARKTVKFVGPENKKNPIVLEPITDIGQALTSPKGKYRPMAAIVESSKSNDEQSNNETSKHHSIFTRFNQDLGFLLEEEPQSPKFELPIFDRNSLGKDFFDQGGMKAALNEVHEGFIVGYMPNDSNEG